MATVRGWLQIVTESSNTVGVVTEMIPPELPVIVLTTRIPGVGIAKLPNTLIPVVHGYSESVLTPAHDVKPLGPVTLRLDAMVTTPVPDTIVGVTIVVAPTLPFTLTPVLPGHGEIVFTYRVPLHT